MQSILDNLYNGNLCPSEKPLIPGSPAEKAHAAFNDAAIQLEQTLSGTEKELFEAAIRANPDKIIVKRPLKSECLAGREPSYTLKGKAIRYDCYVL